MGRAANFAFTPISGRMGSWGSALGSDAFVEVLQNLQGDERITRPHWQHPIVNACETRLAECVQQARIKFWTGPAEEGNELPASDPIWALFRHPNPALTYTRWMRLAMIWFWEYGDHLQALRTDDGRFIGQREKKLFGREPGPPATINPNLSNIHIRPFRGDQVKEEFDDEGVHIGWVFQSKKKGQQIIPVEAAAHIYAPDPYNPNFRRGFGRLQAALRAANMDWQIERFNESNVRNGGLPNVVVIGKHGFTELQMKAIQEQFDKNLTPDKAGQTMTFGGKEIDVKFPGHSPKDMQFPDLINIDWKAIVSVLGCTPAFIGMSEGVQRGNFEESIKHVWENTLVPYLELFADEIQNEILPRFPDRYRDVGVTFETKHIKALQEKTDETIERAIKVFEAFPVTMKEAAQLAGWEIEDEGVSGMEERKAPARPDPQPEDAPGGGGKLSLGAGPKRLDLLEIPTFRTAAAQNFSDQMIGWERRFNRATRRIFEGYINKALRLAKNLADEGQSVQQGRGAAVRMDHSADEFENILIPRIQPWAERLVSAVGPIEQQLLLQQAGLLASSIGADPLLSLADPFALQFLQAKEIRLAETLGTIRLAVKRRLEDALLGGQGIGTLADRIREVLEEYQADLKEMKASLTSRAQNIAETEVNSIANGARLMEAEKQGIKEMRWITGSNPRPHHIELDGRRALIGEVFGFSLRFPGDPQAAVGEVARCNCSIAPTTAGLDEGQQLAFASWQKLNLKESETAA